MKKSIEEIYKDSKELRLELVDISNSDVGCHLGGSLSVIDLLYASYLYFHNSEIILSKGHTSAALYSVLYKIGVLKEKPSLSYGKSTSLLTGHPNHLLDGVLFSTGSLGHGLSYGIGISLANKLKKRYVDTVIIGGDGELQEGLVWESLQIASSKKICNFIYIIDMNNGQNDGKVSQISPYHDLRSRFLSFDFDVIEINGHDYKEIIEAFKLKNEKKALIILANTIKGKGISQLENNPTSHYVKTSTSLARKWKEELK